MDCEKFDEDVMDALYGELPELSEAALRRHVESCSRCASAYASLKSAREVAVLPLVEPSSDLEDRILAAEKAVYGRAPWHRKVVRAAAWAGSHAMRPQLAMAALFMFVIGSSLLLLRARPGTVAAPVSVEQQGSPELAHADKQPDDGFAGRPSGAARTLEDRVESDRGKDARPSDAAKAEAAPAATAEAATADASAAASANASPAPPSEDGAAALIAAKSTRDREGCAAATPQLEGVAKTFAGTPEGRAAAEELSLCAQNVGGAGSMAKGAASPPAKAGGTATATTTATTTSTGAPTATVPPGPR